MEPDAKMRALIEEMNAIHLANSSYWKRGEQVTLEQRTAYQNRLERLNEIRAEQDQLLLQS